MKKPIEAVIEEVVIKPEKIQPIIGISIFLINNIK